MNGIPSASRLLLSCLAGAVATLSVGLSGCTPQTASSASEPAPTSSAASTETGSTASSSSGDGTVAEADVRRHLSVLADDSMAGRAPGAGAEKAAKYIAEQMQAIGLEPGGDSGFFQRVPLVYIMTKPDTLADGRVMPARRQLRVAKSMAQYDSAAPSDRILSANVIGILRGTDPTLKEEAVIIAAHHDHVGARMPRNLKPGDPVPTDTIFNGADDDASGVVAVLEVARALKKKVRHPSVRSYSSLLLLKRAECSVPITTSITRHFHSRRRPLSLQSK